MQVPHFDVFIIGGGINGCGLARDASGRGFSVCLCEMNDLASGTSSASTKLIHGGLRYLEQYAFGLVREALKEREVIWQMAPHLVQPMRFILPVEKGMRPAWLIRLGLFLYDHIGGRKYLAKTKARDLKGEYGRPLKARDNKAYEYSDGWVDDARLVVANARHAKQLGAEILVGHKVQAISRQGDHWQITILEKDSQKTKVVTAAYIANMAGPWVNEILAQVIDYKGPPPVRLVKGSHIVVDKLYDHDLAYFFQNKDGRIIFTIPYQGDFSLIGTTDVNYDEDPKDVHISDSEIEYICSSVNNYFVNPITPQMVKWSFSGVRPLYDDGASKAQEATRDYVLRELDDGGHWLNVYGGKITTFRKLSEDAMVFIEKALGKRQPAWTADVPLPGGNFSFLALDALCQAIARQFPKFDNKTVERLAKSYGSETFDIFANKDFGQHFGHQFYEVELRWLMANEWARTVDDVLWRRTKLGLWFSQDERQKLAQYIESINKA